MNLKIVLVAVSLLAFTACDFGKGRGEDSKPVTTESITGTWEVSAVSANGMTIPYKGTSAANEAGLKNSVERLQYEITASTFRVVQSDELALTLDVQKTYKLNGRKLQPDNSPDNSLSGFEILSVTASTMVIRGEKSEPADMTMTLSRINPGEFAPRKLKRIAQNLSYELNTDKLNSRGSVVAPLNAEIPEGESEHISCRYETPKGKPSTLSFGYATYLSHNGSITIGGDLSSLRIYAPVAFDWDKTSEQKTLQSGIDLIGTDNKGAVKIDINGGDSTQCKLNLSRNNRLIEINGTCTGFSATINRATHATTASLNFHESCAIVF